MRIDSVNVTSSKNCGKKLLKKALTQRVSPSAKISGLKGTEGQRETLALELNDKFFESVHSLFDKKISEKKKPTLLKNEILKLLKELAPGVKVEVKYEKEQGFCGGLETLIDSSGKKIGGFLLTLEKAINKGADEATLRHELTHFFEYITQPKTIARSNTDCLVGRIENYTKKRDLKHFNFYEKVLYTPKKCKNDEKEIKRITERINKYFQKNEVSGEEKIEILQNWRSGLKSELKAYTDEAKYTSNVLHDGDFETPLDILFFEPKIKLLNKMLKKEIAGERALSEQKWGAKQ